MLWFLISNFIFPEKTNGHLVTRIFWTREKISNTHICYRVTVLNNLNKRDHKNYFWKDVSLTIVKFQLKISVILLTFLRKKASQGFFYLYLYICLCILFFFFFFLHFWIFAFCSHDFAFKRKLVLSICSNYRTNVYQRYTLLLPKYFWLSFITCVYFVLILVLLLSSI